MPKDDLSGKKLDNVSLAGEDLEGSDLSNSSLRHSDLKGSKLREANLAGSDLRNARLQDTDVNGADLRGADLTGADLHGVDLRQAAFTEGLTLTGATGLPDDAVPRDEVSANRARFAGREARAECLARLDSERAAWESLVGEIPPAWIDLPNAIGAWSIRDVIAHLSAWRQPFLDELRAAVQGTDPPPTGWPFTPEEIGSGEAEDETKVQVVNEWLYARHAHRTHDQVLAEAALQWTMLRSLVELMPERMLLDDRAFPRLDGRSLADRILDGSLFSHFHDEHEPAMRAWLARMHGRPAAG